MPYRLDQFGFNEMMDCRSRIRDLFDPESKSLADVASQAVEFFHRELVDAEGAPAAALIRFFKTHPFSDLPPELQDVVRISEPQADQMEGLRCLTLLATRGDQSEWNLPEHSRGHRAIPLSSVEMVQRAPMIAQLITQIGIPIASVVRPERAALLETSDPNYNVFYVPQAAGSPYIVAQEEFVQRHGIASVLGFGGLLATGDLFAVILFSRAPIRPETAEQFRVIGLNLKMAVLPFIRKPLFDPRPERRRA